MTRLKKNFVKVLVLTIMFTEASLIGVGGDSNVVKTASAANLFEEYYNTTLKDEYGIFKRNQTGTMKTPDTKWLKHTGLMSGYVSDFDSDGKKEMMVCVAKKNSSDASMSRIVLQMYEKNDEGIFCSSEMNCNPYYSGKEKDAGGSILLKESQWAETSFNINLINQNKEKYIVCLADQQWGSFADGSDTDYWIIKYKNNKFGYVSSLTQNSGGSSGFSYTCFSFKNGKKSKEELYYADGEVLAFNKKLKPKYKEWKMALKQFFGSKGMGLNNKAFDKYGYVKSNRNLLAKQKKSTEILSFTNKETKHNYEKQIFQFKARINSNNKF